MLVSCGSLLEPTPIQLVLYIVELLMSHCLREEVEQAVIYTKSDLFYLLSIICRVEPNEGLYYFII